MKQEEGGGVSQRKALPLTEAPTLELLPKFHVFPRVASFEFSDFVSKMEVMLRKFSMFLWSMNSPLRLFFCGNLPFHRKYMYPSIKYLH